MNDLAWLSRTKLLIGEEPLLQLTKKHVMVVGMGGVGSWVVEALARSAVGHLTLIDADDICVSNTNRQLPALAGQYGRNKAVAMAERFGGEPPWLDDYAATHPAEFFAVTSEAYFVQRERFAQELPTLLPLAVLCVYLAWRYQQSGSPWRQLLPTHLQLTLLNDKVQQQQNKKPHPTNKHKITKQQSHNRTNTTTNSTKNNNN